MIVVKLKKFLRENVEFRYSCKLLWLKPDGKFLFEWYKKEKMK